jgi:hypothetical protein
MAVGRWICPSAVRRKPELIRRRRLVQNSAAALLIFGWLGFAPFPAAAAKFDGCGLY